MAQTMIEVEALTKHYGPVQALKGVTFSVDRGQVVGLLGPNGAGKTTAMRILTGFVAPTLGSARVDGMDVVEDAPGCRRRIGYLPEGNPLYVDLRVEEALAFSARLHGMRGDGARNAVRHSIGVAGLGGLERRLTGALSKGQRQRVGLAQALLHEPDVLILDEPTSGLDPNQQEDMRELIRTLGSERTVILSTHILSEVEAVCDRAIIIDQGLIVANDSVAEIKRQQAEGAHALLVVRGTEADIRRALYEAAPGALVQPVAGSADRHEVRVHLQGLEAHETLERLASAVLGAGLALSHLEARTASLEQIFAHLTRESPRQGATPEPQASEVA